METFQKITGMAEARNSTERSPANLPNPPPIPLDDETRSQYGHSRRGSRASIPLNRKPSQKSVRSARRSESRGNATAAGAHDATEPFPPLPASQGGHTAQDRTSRESAARSGMSDEEEDEGFEWGPSHPCFPHPNPHCAADSVEAKATRVIRVRRDWLQAGDLYPQYANLYPEILDPLVTDEDFRFLVSNVNARLKAAFDPFTSRAWADTLLGVVTGFVWDDLGFTGAKTGIKGLEAFIDKWNADKRREGKDVRVVQLRRTGFMAMDFVIPDPGIDVVEDGNEREGEYEGGIGPAM